MEDTNLIEKQQLIYCDRCGTEIQIGQNFCSNCGQPFNVQNNIDTNAGVSYSEAKKKKKNKKVIILAVLIWLAIVIVISTITISILSKSKEDSAPSSYSSDSDYSSQMEFGTYCLLYMEISDVKLKHSGNYTYISGTITNTGNYQVKYVKVRAACKNYYGEIIDTDWTYAVDSDWLNPGESKTFEMMVKDEYHKISTAEVSVVYE